MLLHHTHSEFIIRCDFTVTHVYNIKLLINMQLSLFRNRNCKNVCIIVQYSIYKNSVLVTHLRTVARETSFYYFHMSCN